MRFISINIFKFTLLVMGLVTTTNSFAKDIQILTKPITNFLPSKPDQKIFGELEFLGGAELTSKNEDFGGLSGIEFRTDQNKFIIITDKARFITGKIIREDSKISEIKNATLTRTRNSKGKIITGAEDKDSEAITITQDGQIILGYERNDRIAVFNEKKKKLIQDKRSEKIDLNSYDFPNNKGIEAVALSNVSKTLFVFAEHALNKEGNHRGFIVKNNAITEIAIEVPNGYSITDAALLPNDELIILERYYSFFTGPSMRIRRFPKTSDILPEAVLKGKTIFEANSQYEIDNMEGMAITQMADGSNRLTLVSDDNFSKNQRTLLLEFKLLD